MEQALVNTVIAFKLMSYSYSLKYFFKDEFKKYEKPCHGHQFLDFIEKLWEFEVYATTEKKCFFRDFYFYNFRLKTDVGYSMSNQIDQVVGWNFYAINAKNLSHLSYSQRLSYLN